MSCPKFDREWHFSSRSFHGCVDSECDAARRNRPFSNATECYLARQMRCSEISGPTDAATVPLWRFLFHEVTFVDTHAIFISHLVNNAGLTRILQKRLRQTYIVLVDTSDALALDGMQLKHCFMRNVYGFLHPFYARWPFNLHGKMLPHILCRTPKYYWCLSSILCSRMTQWPAT